ncbi:putative dhh family protein [Purpureocillium lavendulum]|uniref:Dhh family protein n=1 Tax=Purpureocillium lavendulum TaxID=1247861 RepID=A0AB34FKB7_9HYPO|nr:putative dhh family protein [Purpureocillium lavendulum]
MKRAASSSAGAPPRGKKARPQVPDYHLTPSRRTDKGDTIWPAPEGQIERARQFIIEWYAFPIQPYTCDSSNYPSCSVTSHQKTVIVPDKDADGLTSGAILRKTLLLLGLEAGLIEGHILQKGNTVHDDAERQAIAAKDPAYIFILDQGSRKSPPVIDAPHKALVIDHHWALDDDFPQGAEHVTACNSPPVATSSLLTYHICSALHDDVEFTCDWLCVMGTHGDLGNTLKWEPPFPDMKRTFKTHTKKALNDAVSLINAPRRTASYNVPMAWEALLAAASPADLLTNRALLSARAEVNAEVERCTHTAPKFSADARIAVFRISSPAQVHPVIATRWAGHLQSAKLEVVLVANEGYLPGMVNFSCRIPRSARAREPPVDIIATLRGLADGAADATLRARLGESFARGHKEASGGIVPKQEFEELMAVLEMDRNASERKAAKSSKPLDKAKQSNTLDKYFAKG